MKTRNEVIYSVREIIGDETPEGFFTILDDGTKVPNYLFKDGKSIYPEIRISPFIDNQERTMLESKLCSAWRNFKDIYKGKFQIDIFSTNIPQLNKICREIETRIKDFTDVEAILYDYTPDFVQIGDYYKNTIYDKENFNIGWLSIDGIMLKSVSNIDELVENSWFISNDGLYVKTDLDITKLKVLCIYGGRFFNNHDSLYRRGIFSLRISNTQNLSALENNEVERIIIEIDIIYGLDRPRKDGPLVDNINIGAKDG
jgi:hypothetical protein